MSVKDSLDKIVERHPDIVGAVVLRDGKVFHNLEAPYDMISVDEIMGIFADTFEQTSLLSDEGFEFADLLMEFDAHSFVVRKLDDALLAVVAPSLARGQLVKLQVGLPLFGKAVQKALDETDVAPEPVVVDSVAEPEPEAPAPIEELAPVEPASDEADSVSGIMRHRKGMSRAARALVGRTIDAVSDPQPKEEPQQDEPVKEAFSDDGVPLRPDGTPKTRRVYRGVVFYE